MDLAISGHITHGSGMKSPEFKQFLDQFPAWSYPVGWTATYKSFKFQMNIKLLYTKYTRKLWEK